MFLFLGLLAASTLLGVKGRDTAWQLKPRYLVNVNGALPSCQECQQGTCNVLNGVRFCTCYDGWTGERCNILKWTLQIQSQSSGQFVNYQCSGHGYWNGYGCVCNSGWSGNQCQVAELGMSSNLMSSCNGISCNHELSSSSMSMCNSMSCQHGSCTTWYSNGHMYSQCSCHYGWHGQHCDQSYSGTGHQCGSLTCQHGRCEIRTDQYGQRHFRCGCDNGWHGNQCDLQDSDQTGTSQQCYGTTCVNGYCKTWFDSNRHQHHECSCNTGWTGNQCDQQTLQSTTEPSTQDPEMSPTTSMKPVTIQTDSPVTVTLNLISSTTQAKLDPCDKLSVLTPVSTQTQVSDSRASTCPSGTHTTSEALVFHSCPLTGGSTTWRPGVNVMTLCSDGSGTNTEYLAIAAFENGQYSPAGSLSGVLVGCLDDGFKMALQRCDSPPHIINVQTGGVNLENPNVYYTII